MIFTDDIKEYRLTTAELKSPKELNSGLWLILAGVNDIPPHIALVSDGSYYSVSARRVEVGGPVEKFLKALSRRTTHTVFVKIKTGNNATPSGGLRRDFQKYPTLGHGNHSCLWPVRDVLARIFSPGFGKCSLVFEVLALAQQQGIIEECKTLFVNNHSGSLILPKYTVTEIHERINSIHAIKE